MTDRLETRAQRDAFGFPWPSRNGLLEKLPKPNETILPPDATLAAVITQLYQAAAGDDTAWEPALIALRNAFGGNAGQIALATPRRKRFELNLIAASGLDLMSVSAYEDNSFDDPSIPALLALPRTAVSGDCHYTDELILARKNSLSIPDAFSRFLTLCFILDGTIHTLAVLRSSEDPPFTEDDCSRFQTLMPDFDRIASILAMRRQLYERPAAMAVALDSMAGAFGLVNGNGDVIHLNPRADHLVQSLDIALAPDPAWLLACVDAIRLRHASYCIAGKVIGLSRMTEKGGAETGVFRAYFSDLLLVDFNDLMDAKEGHLIKISANFGLTVSESEVLGMLALGEDAKSIARQRGTSHETVRTQLRTIRQKTQLASREKLVALVMSDQVC